MIGQLLHNRYTLAALIGKGAMGDVYCATDAQTGQKVAVKVIARNLSLDPEMLERFRREGEALRQLRHPNIVGFVEMFLHAGQQIIVMEYVSGGSLHELIKQGPLPIDRARRIALELCDALTRAHHLNIVHRDIKPENILLAEDGTPKLTDFGVARLLDEGTRLTGTGRQIGTPYYMSPEAWEGKALDAQADIWSLGVVLYEMLAGEVPFGGDTVAAVMTKVLTAAPPALIKARPEVPAAWADIIQRMLTRDRKQRYASMRQVGADIERGAPAVPAHPVKRAPTWAWWGLGLSGVGVCFLASVIFLVGGGTLFATFLRSSQTPAAAPSVWQTARPILGAATDTPTLTTSTAHLTDTPAPPASSNLSIGSTMVAPKDGMVMVYIPAGEFLMGSTDNDSAANPDEKPQHTVYLEAYWIDKTDVTNAMFTKFVAATTYKTLAEKEGGGVCQGQSSTGNLVAGNNWLHPCGPTSNIQGKDNHPVVQVTWWEAKAYCEWAGRRLLTEAEWEKAARGVDGRKYPWGNNSPDKTLLNFNMQVGGTTEAGLYPLGASPYGVLDMAGNVWQWIADWYSDSYYTVAPAQNPKGPESGDARVMRGGSWSYAAWAMRTTVREIWGQPDARYSDIGFRCAISP